MIKLTRIYNKRFSQSKIVQSLKTLDGFKLLSTNYSDDLKIHVNQLIHQKTGAKIYNLENNDQDNTFATVFKTFPSDSKGCPHILEHLACCGSQKYPIRDPFFNMLKRSVNTYMNAWTGQDFTCYPFSSANPKDWNNLFNVYTDMSFKPLLNELDFLQQGWRYEINEQGQKQIKGIVFNEMKGSYQSSERQLMMALNQGLFSGTGYRHDSGGKPEQIVNLSYNQLIEMYNYFYHPSNMSIFLYGNQDISQSLKKLNQDYLNKYEKSGKYNHGQIIKPELPKDKYQTISSKTAQTNSISLFFYIKNIEEITPAQSISFKILQYLMFQKNTSYIYQRFIETGKAQNLGYSGFNESKLTSFGVTLKGVQAEYQCEQYYRDIVDVLKEISEKGVNQKRLDEFLHELQIGIKTPKQNFGIKLLQESLNYMNHRLQLISYLTPLKYIDEAKQNLLDPRKLKAFISKNFLENQHFVVVKQLVDQSEQASSEEAKPITSSISFKDQEIKQKQEALKKRQSMVQDVNILPKLKLQDLIARKRIEPLIIEDFTKKDRHLRYFHVPIQNQIHFYRFVFTFKNLDFDVNDRLGLWNFLINKGISTKKYNYKELSSKLGQFTAGFYSAASFGTKDSVNIVLGISCLKRNKDQLLNLMEEMLFEPVFQDQNIKNLYRAFENEAVETLTGTPVSQCVDQCGSSLNLTSRLFNKYQKIKTGLQLIKDSDMQQLKNINHFLLSAQSVTLIEHSNQKINKLPRLFERFQQHNVRKPQKSLFTPNYNSKAVTHNFDVNFCTQQYQGPDYLSQQHAEMCILTQFLEQEYLHPQIRQKGGAYGARSKVRQWGNISLYSYMDPESSKTFKVFDQSVEKVKNLDVIQSQKLQEIKINLLGQLQRVNIPQEQCVGPILKGVSAEQFEQFLSWIKRAQSESIINLSRKYLDTNKKSRCVFGKQVPEGFIQQKLSSFI